MGKKLFRKIESQLIIFQVNKSFSVFVIRAHAYKLENLGVLLRKFPVGRTRGIHVHQSSRWTRKAGHHRSSQRISVSHLGVLQFLHFFETHKGGNCWTKKIHMILAWKFQIKNRDNFLEDWMSSLNKRRCKESMIFFGHVQGPIIINPDLMR